MRVNKNSEITFNEAVEFLKGTFVDKIQNYKPTNSVAIPSAKKEKTLINIESDNISLARYGMFMKKASERLVKSTKITSDKKNALYEQLELLDCLVAHRKISADTGIEVLKYKLNSVGILL